MVPAAIIIIIAFVGFFTWVGLSWHGVIKRVGDNELAISQLREEENVIERAEELERMLARAKERMDWLD